MSRHALGVRCRPNPARNASRASKLPACKVQALVSQLLAPSAAWPSGSPDTRSRSLHSSCSSRETSRSPCYSIVLSEVLFLSLRPRPRLSASTFRPPAPDQWQTPITVLRWTSLISSVWAIVTGAVVLTIAITIVIVVLVVIGWHHGLGASNFAVLALFGLWLLTRPLWIAPLRRALRVEATRQLAPYMATAHVGTDGVEVDMRPAFIRRAPESYRFSVGFAELDEVRIMDGLTAQGYWGSMGQYDPTIGIRMEIGAAPLRRRPESQAVHPWPDWFRHASVAARFDPALPDR